MMCMIRFCRFGRLMLQDDSRRLALFNRMAERSGIAHRYSFLWTRPPMARRWIVKAFTGWARFPTRRRG